MKHKKLLISLALLIVVLLALTITCPKADDHREVIRSEVASAMSQSLQSNGADAFSPFIQSIIVPTAVNLIIVDNYTVCSIGRFEWKGKSSVISVGILGHVYVLSSNERLDKKLQDLVTDETK